MCIAEVIAEMDRPARLAGKPDAGFIQGGQQPLPGLKTGLNPRMEEECNAVRLNRRVGKQIVKQLGGHIYNRR